MKSRDSAAQALDQLLASRVLKLDRSVLTFHYEHDDFHLQNQAEVADHVAEWTMRFFNPSASGGGEAGPGVYGANDPQSSRALYGGATPKLFVIPLRAGIRVLNLDIVSKESDYRVGNQLMKDLGCPEKFPSESFNNFFSQMRQSKSNLCRNLMIEAVRRTGATAITYAWRSETQLKNCRAFRPDAINIISPAAIDLENIAYFTDDIEISPDAKLGARVGRLFNDLDADPINQARPQYGIPQHRPRTLKTRRGRSRDYEAWKSQWIAYCGPIWSLESDSSLYAGYLTKIRAMYLDQEARRLQAALNVETSKGAERKGDYQSLFRIRGLENLMALRMGIQPGTQQFDKWLAAKDQMEISINSDPDDVKAAKAARSLCESSARLSNGFDFFYLDRPAEFLAEQPASLDMAPEMIRAMGFGPVVSELITSRFLEINYLTPLILERRMTEPTESAEEIAEKNKRLVRQFLKHCLSVWSEPTTSLENKKNGECGARPRKDPSPRI